MRDVRWTNQAVIALASLTDRQRRKLLERIDVARQFPAMYPARQRGRFVNLRYFILEKRWLVYYRAEESGALLIFDIIPALARPR